MGLFDSFKNKSAQHYKSEAQSWHEIAAEIAGTLWILLNKDPSILAEPYSRIIMRTNWSIYFANSQCQDPKKLLGIDGAAIVFLNEDREALKKWIEGLDSGSPILQQIETEQFAKVLMRKLRDRAKVE